VSLKLFKNKGFIKTGTKQQWIISEKTWIDESMFQLIFES
jgi:L-amino acid N-acyltransferase YncA